MIIFNFRKRKTEVIRATPKNTIPIQILTNTDLSFSPVSGKLCFAVEVVSLSLVLSLLSGFILGLILSFVYTYVTT